jgi:hypothetical protein
MDELDRLKSEIDLTAFAASRGYGIDRRESSRSSVVMRHPVTDDKIIVSRAALDGHWVYFSVRDARDHGTIVDFVQRRGGGDLGAVRRVLLSWIGADRAGTTADHVVTAVRPRVVDRAAVARRFEAAHLVVDSAYLDARGIARATLRCDRFVGTFRRDARGNVLFPHRDGAGLSGFESKNHGWTSFASGGVRALWRSNTSPEDRELVLVESAIDALSFHQLHGAPRARYGSTAGTLSAHQRELLAEMFVSLRPEMVVVLAFDRDAAGEKLAEQVRALGRRAFRRDVPVAGKDWNECLQLRARRRLRSPEPSRGHG